MLEEGCLSLPGIHVEVERPIYVRVGALDEHGTVRRVEASGLEASVIQHEMDHLDGVLILDRTSKEQRKEAMRALREQDGEAEARLARPPRAHGLPGDVGLRRRGARAARPSRTTGPLWWSRAPTAQPGAVAGMQSPPVA